MTIILRSHQQLERDFREQGTCSSQRRSVCPRFQRRLWQSRGTCWKGRQMSLLCISKSQISCKISKVANPKHPQTTNNLQSYQVLKPSPNGFAWFSRPSIGLSWEQNLEMEDRIRSIRSHVWLQSKVNCTAHCVEVRIYAKWFKTMPWMRI